MNKNKEKVETPQILEEPWNRTAQIGYCSLEIVGVISIGLK
jgi:hypothetical protein